MRERRIGLICALKEECSFLLAKGGWRRLPARLPKWECKGTGGGRARVVISGMGRERAVAGLEILVAGFDPETIISFGFGGSLDPRLRVGDLIWGREVLQWEEGRGVSGVKVLTSPSETASREIEPPARWQEGFLVSVEGFVPKAVVRSALDARCSPAVLEMETYALATALGNKDIPLMGLRAVSDEWDFDPAPLVRECLDNDLRIRPSKVISNVVRHPACLTVLFGLFQRSRRAAVSLAEGIRALLNT